VNLQGGKARYPWFNRRKERGIKLPEKDKIIQGGGESFY